MIFRDRSEAARMLIRPLERFRGQQVVVLSVPRGGVPMGVIIARHFGWEHGLLLTKKIGHPMNPEYAIGAVGMDLVLVDESQTDVPQVYIDAEVERIRESIHEREQLFLKGRPHPDLKGKYVVIVDDGIATGYTMRASVQILRQQQPLKIVVAVPVAPAASVTSLKKIADEVIVLYAPKEFSGVGQFYTDFSEVTDLMVTEALDRLQQKIQD